MERKDFAARDRAGSSDTDTDEEYKQRIVKAKGPDATTTIAIDDILQVRALKNSLTDGFHRLKATGTTRLEPEEFTVGSLRRARQGGSPDASTYMAGTIAERISGIVTVKELTRSGCLLVITSLSFVIW